MKTHQIVLDPKIKSVELTSIGRGNHDIEITYQNGGVIVSRFSTKKEAKEYYDWITNNPKHSLHKNRTPQTLLVSSNDTDVWALAQLLNEEQVSGLMSSLLLQKRIKDYEL